MKTPFELFGKECDDGWDGLVQPLIKRVTELEGSIFQIKEKFGGLRFYADLPEGVSDEDSDAFYEMVDKAEAASFQTCEVCGGAGKPRPTGWIKTLCDKHFQERLHASS